MKLGLGRKVKVGITMGDPSGIGPEITLLALRKLKWLADFVVIGDEWVLGRVQRSKVKGQRSKVEGQGWRVVDLHNVKRGNFRFGKVSAEYGRASIAYLDKAMALLKSGEIDCLVTCPISKEAIHKAGFTYSGHTEYFSALTRCRNLAMMLLNDRLKFTLVTRHIPLKDVALKFSQEKITSAVILSFRALRDLFGIKSPRIIIAGLNPHASDNGTIGSEELRVISPVVKRLAKGGINLVGPVSADIAIAQAARKDYDCVIAAYHDQALIPLKLLGNESGVNITLGLPFVRTSALHGTAFDIAGKRIATAASLISAIKLAVSCVLNNAQHRTLCGVN